MLHIIGDIDLTEGYFDKGLCLFRRSGDGFSVHY